MAYLYSLHSAMNGKTDGIPNGGPNRRLETDLKINGSKQPYGSLLIGKLLSLIRASGFEREQICEHRLRCRVSHRKVVRITYSVIWFWMEQRGGGVPNVCGYQV